MTLTIEGHERCIPLEQFNKLMELHDQQKKIIAKLQEENQSLKDKLDNIRTK